MLTIMRQKGNPVEKGSAVEKLTSRVSTRPCPHEVWAKRGPRKKLSCLSFEVSRARDVDRDVAKVLAPLRWQCPTTCREHGRCKVGFLTAFDEKQMFISKWSHSKSISYHCTNRSPGAKTIWWRFCSTQNCNPLATTLFLSARSTKQSLTGINVDEEAA